MASKTSRIFAEECVPMDGSRYRVHLPTGFVLMQYTDDVRVMARIKPWTNKDRLRVKNAISKDALAVEDIAAAACREFAEEDVVDASRMLDTNEFCDSIRFPWAECDDCYSSSQ